VQWQFIPAQRVNFLPILQQMQSLESLENPEREIDFDAEQI
jgi:hypothetical protein